VAADNDADMPTSRRTFLQETLLSGGLAGLVGPDLKTHELTERLLAFAAQDSTLTTGKHDSKSFWDSFGAAADNLGGETPQGVHGRGLIHKSSANTGAGDLDRQIDFFHYTKDKRLQYANTIEAKEMLDHAGDITASVNVSGFRLAGEDREQFDKLQSAQLRIDVLQSKSLMNILDPMAWTSLAALFPDKSGKLPPMQDLSFDPATTWEQMQKIVLPGGVGKWAVNLSMAHKESQFVSIMKSLTTEINRFAPVLGLPAISMTALKGFCSLYGAFEQRTTFLLNSFPQLAFATQAAREEAQTHQGLNLLTGDYILVPHSYTAQLTPYLDKLEMRQGYLVSKDAPSNTSVFDLATNLTPDITYLSANINLKPLTQPPSSSGRTAKTNGQ
jgi:hypothetical protein